MGGGGNNPDFWGQLGWEIVRRMLILTAMIGIAAGLYWMWA